MNTQQQVKALINQYIKTNGTGAITGALLNEVLQAMVGLTGLGYNFAGVATPETNPGTLTYVAFYIAGPGTYENMGSVTVPPGNIGIIDNSNNGAWALSLLQITLANNAVTTSKLANEVVTVAKLASDVIALLNAKADIDGFYSTMGVGAAENLIGRGSVMADFTFRTSGGTADIGSGLARIKKLMGNTVVWNQKLPIPSSSITETKNNMTLTDNRDGTYQIETTELGVSSSTSFLIAELANLPVGHKILYRGTPRQDSVRFYMTFNGQAEVESYKGSIVTIGTTAAIAVRIHALMGGIATTPLDFRPQVFDLTQMFGDGKEPATVAEFEALFPYLFYPYNEGELLSVKATGLKTVGFNQWDEQSQSGYWDTSTGQHVNNYAWVCSKNPIRVLPNTTYYNVKDANTFVAVFYDSNMNIVGYHDGRNATFTTPANAYYMHWYGSAAGFTFCCINLSWSGYRNGEYEAYWENTLPLPITTLTGKLNGAGESITIFANGMKSVGNVYDETTEDEAAERIGVADMGLLDGYSVVDSSEGIFMVSKPNDAILGWSALNCARYAYHGNDGFSTPNHCISDSESETYQTKWFIHDTRFAGMSAADIKSALNGVKVYYILATPKNYTLDTPLNLQYQVDDFGTEMELPQNDDEPATAPLRYEVQYAMNAVDTLRRLPENYISKESFLDFLAEFDSKVGAAINATIVSTMTFDSESQKYGFDISITPNT